MFSIITENSDVNAYVSLCTFSHSLIFVNWAGTLLVFSDSKTQEFFSKVILFLFQLLILLRMDDKINRQLTAPITEEDSSLSLADELVHYGFIGKVRFSVPFCFIWYSVERWGVYCHRGYFTIIVIGWVSWSNNHYIYQGHGYTGWNMLSRVISDVVEWSRKTGNGNRGQLTSAGEPQHVAVTNDNAEFLMHKISPRTSKFYCWSSMVCSDPLYLCSHPALVECIWREAFQRSVDVGAGESAARITQQCRYKRPDFGKRRSLIKWYCWDYVFHP